VLCPSWRNDRHCREAADCNSRRAGYDFNVRINLGKAPGLFHCSRVASGCQNNSVFVDLHCRLAINETMMEIVQRAIDNLFGRIDGPMAIRLAIQPLMAAAFALRDGLRDARQNHAPYGLSLFLDAEHRGHRLRDGWGSIRTVFCVALVVDVVYQLLQLDWVYIGEALIVAQIVALVPYVIVRSLANRVARMLIR
jgi:hypothetical protein